MPVVIPARVIQNRVKTEPVYRNTAPHSIPDFVAYIIEPIGAQIVLCSGFGNEHWPAIPVPDFEQNLVKGPITWMVPGNRFAIVNPFVAIVKIDADNIQVIRLTAQLRPNTAAKHVPRFKHRLRVG